MYKFQSGGIFQRFNYDNIYQNSYEDIKELQRALGVKDDGMIGRQTISALQNKIGTKVDGLWGKNSIAAAKNFAQSSQMQQVPQMQQTRQVNRSAPREGSIIGRIGNQIKGLFNSRNSNQEQPVIAAGMEDVPNVEAPEQTSTNRGSFVESLSRALSGFGMHNSQNAEPINNNTNVSQETTPDLQNVPTMSMGEYLYRSGSVGTGRRIGNLLSVGSNLIRGMINPDGNNATLSEGGRRQLVGASLYHYDNPELVRDPRTGKWVKEQPTYRISDRDHAALGGINGHSGAEFRQDATDAEGNRQSVNYIEQAMNAPYHNIFGASGYTSASGERFSPTTDGYTFNNVWNGQNVSELQDGEGSMSLLDSIRAGRQAYNSGSGLKAAIETAASQRGVNVSAGKSTYVSEKDRDRYAREYQEYVNSSPEERARINAKFGYTK